MAGVSDFEQFAPPVQFSHNNITDKDLDIVYPTDDEVKKFQDDLKKRIKTTKK